MGSSSDEVLQRALKELQILVVDDQVANVRLLESILRAAGYKNIEATTDSRQVEWLSRRLEPDLVLMDLHMPDADGFELLKQLEPAIASRQLSALVITADDSLDSRRLALTLGARDFLTKPLDATEVLLRVRNLLETQYLQSQLEDENQRLADRVGERTGELDQARRELLDRLALVAEYRDYDTSEHTRRVGRTTALLAQKIGLSETETETLRDAAPLHDIGKLGVSDRILLKPGRLTNNEMIEMRRHVEFGAEILSGSQSPVLQLAEEIARTHHEQWNGRGYLNGLHSDEIPLSGRLTAVADVFDALTHKRPYKDELPVHEAVAVIELQAGRQFDPSLVKAFLELDHEQLV